MEWAQCVCRGGAGRGDEASYEIRWGVETSVRFGRDKRVCRRRKTGISQDVGADVGCLKWTAEGRASWRVGVRSGSLRSVGISIRGRGCTSTLELSGPRSPLPTRPAPQNVPPDLAICCFVLEQSLSVRALQEMLANTVEAGVEVRLPQAGWVVGTDGKTWGSFTVLSSSSLCPAPRRPSIWISG